jgi:hypothetical protein
VSLQSVHRGRRINQRPVTRRNSTPGVQIRLWSWVSEVLMLVNPRLKAHRSRRLGPSVLFQSRGDTLRRSAVIWNSDVSRESVWVPLFLVWHPSRGLSEGQRERQGPRVENRSKMRYSKCCSRPR